MKDDELIVKIAEVKKYIDENIKEVIDCTAIVDKFNLNLRIFRDQFFLITGLTPMQYINRVRLNTLVKILKNEEVDNHQKLIAYANEIGLNSAASFCEFVKRQTKMTSMEFIIHIKSKNESSIHV